MLPLSRFRSTFTLAPGVRTSITRSLRSQPASANVDKDIENTISLTVTTRLNIRLPRQWSHPVDNYLLAVRRLHMSANIANGKTTAGRKWLCLGVRKKKGKPRAKLSV